MHRQKSHLPVHTFSPMAANRQKTKQGFSADCKQPLYQVVFVVLIREANRAATTSS
jgi:hypothetical protein